MDCIILAGNRESYRRVTDQDNKAFLLIDEHTILHHMMVQIAEVPEIDRLLIVGPAARLEAEITKIVKADYPKPVRVFEQKKDLVSNAVSVVDATSGDRPADGYVLILPCDIPVMVAEELREFIGLCNMDRYDYVVGLVTDKTLCAFYPEKNKPGVRMAYFYAGEHGYRPSNLHMVRPSRFGRLRYVREIYAVRYQKKWINILRSTRTLFSMIRYIPGSAFVYIHFRIARFFRIRGFTRFGYWLQKRIKLSTAERYGSYILDTRFKLVTTSYGGAAIDVDNEEDYATIIARRAEWIQQQKNQVQNGDLVKGSNAIT